MQSNSYPSSDIYALSSLIPVAEVLLGYNFDNKLLLLEALTHRSYCNEFDTVVSNNDALEWLGDSVLQSYVSNWIYATAEDKSAQFLTKVRQRFVDTKSCATYAIKLGLPSLIRAGRGHYSLNVKMAADCFEAVLGAMHIDILNSCRSGALISELLATVIPSYSDMWNNVNEISIAPTQCEHTLMNSSHRLINDFKINDDHKNTENATRMFYALGEFFSVILRDGQLSYESPTFTEIYGIEGSNFVKSFASSPEFQDLTLDGLNLSLNSNKTAWPNVFTTAINEVLKIPVQYILESFSTIDYVIGVLVQECSDKNFKTLLSLPFYNSSILNLMEKICYVAGTSLFYDTNQRKTMLTWHERVSELQPLM